MTKAQRRIVRRRLIDYSFIADEIAVKEADLRRLRGGVRVTRYDPTGITIGRGGNDAIGGTVIRINDLEKQLEKLRVKQNEVDTLLLSLGFFERKVIRVKWLERHTWRETADALGYSEAYISIIERAALEKIWAAMQKK